VFTPLVHVDFAVTDIPLEPSARLRVAGESRLARVLDGEGGLRHIARQGSWTIRTSDGREVARARLVNVFTRYDVDPARRRVTELPPELGLGPLPSNTIDVPTLEDLVPPERAAECRDEEPRVWHYGETDPNRHVNGMAYLRTFEEQLATILHRRGHDLTRVYEVRARLVFRKPCFRGQGYRRLAWCRGESPLMMTAAVVAADAREGERPAVAAELTFGLHEETGVAAAAP
jgi:hypothetical protein